MMAATAEDWVEGAFLSRDRSRVLVDFDGADCRYDDALSRAPADADVRITPDRLRGRHGLVVAAQERLRADIAVAALDALVVVGDDQEELFTAINMPAIGVYYGATIRNARATPARDALGRARMRFQEDGADAEYPCHPALAEHLITALGADGFDLSAMGGLGDGQAEGHAYSYVHRFCLGDRTVPIVPVFLNAYYPPNQPTPARCHALGGAIRRAVEAWPVDARVGVLASGGLSHFLVDEALDHAVIDALRSGDGAALRGLPLHKLRSGSSEIRNWICLGGAISHLAPLWITYVPGYRTPALTGTGLCFASFA
jgi:3-O-methylgallate 3,4-dioxygenase